MKKGLLVSLELIGLVLLSWLCIVSRAPAIEEDIRSRVGDALENRSMDWALVRVDGRDVVLEGVAPGSEVQNEAVTLAGGVWGVRIVTDRLTVSAPKAPIEPEPDAASCQDQLNDLLADQSLLFATASAEIHPDSLPLLDELAARAARCPNAQIEVAGHADSRGGDDFNLRLSQARAEAVVAYIVRSGLDRGRLSAVGYGETRPVADNEGATGQARNRRVQFVVRGN